MKHILRLALIGTAAAGLLTLAGCRREAEKAGTAQQAREAKYHCPMHPTYTADKPGECPICGMALVPIEEEATAPPPSAAPGQASVSIPAERLQTIGVRVEPAAMRDLAAEIRASARVAYDPELFSAITEYKQAVVTQARVKESPWPDVHERAEALVRASALRLRQLGLSEAQIEEAAATEGDPTGLLLAQPGGAVWVYAQVYEYELRRVKPGQAAEITSPAFPGRSFRGTVRSVSPVLAPETRSARVMIEVPNPGGALSLEMYVEAIIRAPLGRRLAVPAEAVMDTGARRLVFVESAPGRFDPRPVEVGAAAQGYRPVLAGLKEGERVVASGNFLIDSESKLKAALSSTNSHAH